MEGVDAATADRRILLVAATNRPEVCFVSLAFTSFFNCLKLLDLESCLKMQDELCI